MRINRKYNLDRVGHRYESVEIGVDGEDVEEMIKRIDAAWRLYCKAIVDEVVQ